VVPEFPHVVEIEDDLWGVSQKGHPVAWCDRHVPKSEWQFYLRIDPDDLNSDESYVFSFQDVNLATQFALLYA
jgi:hypothetical protein